MQERWGRPIWAVLEVLIDQCITCTRLALGLGPSLLVSDSTWGNQDRDEDEEGGSRVASPTAAEKLSGAPDSKHGPLQAALMGLRVLLAVGTMPPTCEGMPYQGWELADGIALCMCGRLCMAS